MLKLLQLSSCGKKKKKSRKKSIPTEKFFLQDKSFMTIYCKCHVINVMCWM